MTKDPVCGGDVDKRKAVGSSQYQGTTYHFFSAGWKATFDKEPAKYAKA